MATNAYMNVRRYVSSENVDKTMSKNFPTKYLTMSDFQEDIKYLMEIGK